MKSRRSPWVLGIIIGFAVMMLVNAVFIYIAVKGADQIVPSYHSEQR
jgi:type IV secretory pathway VirB3-like protein